MRRIFCSQRNPSMTSPQDRNDDALIKLGSAVMPQYKTDRIVKGKAPLWKAIIPLNS